MTFDATKLEQELREYAGGLNGPCSDADQRRILNYTQMPTAETWDAISTIPVFADKGTRNEVTLHEAVCEVDRLFPKEKLRYANGRTEWPLIPTPELVAEAVERAVCEPLSIRRRDIAVRVAAIRNGEGFEWIDVENPMPFDRHSPYPTIDVRGDIGVVYKIDDADRHGAEYVGRIKLTPELRYLLAEFALVVNAEVTDMGHSPVFGKPEPSQADIGHKPDYAAMAAKAEAAPQPVPTKEELVASIQRNMIGQTDSIRMAATYVRGKLASKPSPDGRSKPLVFLATGPTGTGKTEFAKSLASALGVDMVRFDMGEYGEDMKVSNLFGSSKGYVGSEDGGDLPNAIRQVGKGANKRLVILFDEVEKAHHSIWQKLLAFLDEGRAADSKGSEVAPKNTIVILTTNRMAEEIAKSPDSAKVLLIHDAYFSREMLGRIDKIIPFPKLPAAKMLELTHRQLAVKAASYGLSLVIVEEEALLELFSKSRENADLAGGRGITETIQDLLLEDMVELQCEGVERARLAMNLGTIRVLAA